MCSFRNLGNLDRNLKMCIIEYRKGKFQGEHAMQILADEGIVNTLGTMFSDLSDKVFYVVQLEPASPGYNRQDIHGLDIALEIAPTGIPVVMLGWLTPEMYIDKKADKWFAANGYPNVVFLRLPATSQEVLTAIEKIETDEKAGDQFSDPLAIDLLGVAEQSSAIGILHHDIYSAQHDTNRMVQWEKKAREIFGDKNQAELISLVTEAAKTRHAPGKLTGNKYPDVCIDIEGTILTADGQIRREALALTQARAAGGPITVWTGGNVYELSKQLRKAGILYKIVSKETMRGAAVRLVIDDQTEAAFKEQYGIEYQEYIQV